MRVNVGEVYFDLVLNSKGFKKQLNNTVANSVEHVGTNTKRAVAGTFGKIGKMAAAAFSIKAVASFAKSCTDLGSDLDEVQNVVDTVFGDMTDDINSFANNAIKQFGLSETVAKQYAGTFGAMAKSFGFTTEEAAKLSKELTGLVGDVASFYNLDPTVSYTKLKAVFTGETEALKELGVVMTQNALDQFALEKGYKKTTKNMTEQEKVALRFAFVQDKLRLATGDFVKTQDGWANQLRVLRLQWDSFKAALGRGFINILTPVIKSLNMLMSKLVALANTFAAFTTKLFGKGNEVSGGISSTTSEMAELNNTTAGFGDAAKKSAKKAAQSLLKFDELNLLSSNDSGGDTGGGVSGGGAAIPDMDFGLSKLNTDLEMTDERFNEIKQKLEDSLWFAGAIGGAIMGWKIASKLSEIKAMQKYLKDSGKMLQFKVGISMVITGGILEGKGIKDMVTRATSRLKAFFEMLAGSGVLVGGARMLGGVFGKELLGAGIGGIVAGVPLAIGGVFDAIKNGMDWLNATIIPIGTTMAGAGVGAIIGSIGGPMGALIGLVIGVLTDLIILIVQKWDVISKFFKDNFAKAKEFFSQKFNNLKETVSTNIGYIKNNVSESWNNLRQNTKEGWNNIHDTVAEKTASMKAHVHENLETIKAWFEKIPEKAGEISTKIKDKFMAGFNQMKDAIKAPINGIIKSFNKMIDGLNKIKVSVPDWVPGMGGKDLGFNIKPIPMLAQGGFVKANTPQLAMIGDNRHEGEIVAPESKLHEAVSEELRPLLSVLIRLLNIIEGQGGDKGDVIIPISLDGEILEQFIVSLNDRRILRTGGR